MHIALSPIVVVFVDATTTLQANGRAADQTNRSVDGERFAVFAHQRLVLSVEKAVEHQREAGEAIGGGIVQRDSTVEKRCRMSVTVVSAPARERVL